MELSLRSPRSFAAADGTSATGNNCTAWSSSGANGLNGNPNGTDTGWANAEVFDLIRAANPQGRWGQPEDAARLIGWLATDDAQWITGQTINSNGGGL